MEKARVGEELEKKKKRKEKRFWEKRTQQSVEKRVPPDLGVNLYCASKILPYRGLGRGHALKRLPE